MQIRTPAARSQPSAGYEGWRISRQVLHSVRKAKKGRGKTKMRVAKPMKSKVKRKKKRKVATERPEQVTSGEVGLAELRAAIPMLTSQAEDHKRVEGKMEDFARKTGRSFIMTAGYLQGMNRKLQDLVNAEVNRQKAAAERKPWWKW